MARSRSPVTVPTSGIASTCSASATDSAGFGIRTRPRRTLRRTVVRLAEAFDVSTDYLLIDGSPRRSYRAPSEPIADRLSQLDALGEADRVAVIRILDGLLTNTRIRQALNPAS